VKEVESGAGERRRERRVSRRSRSTAEQLSSTRGYYERTWKVAALMSEYSRPNVAVLRSSNERTRIWTMPNETNGTKKAIRAAAQMGMMLQARAKKVRARAGREGGERERSEHALLAERVGELRVHDLAVLRAGPHVCQPDARVASPSKRERRTAKVMANERVGAGSASYTPSATAPRAAIVTACPKRQLERMES